jgi:hypothetical protein
VRKVIQVGPVILIEGLWWCWHAGSVLWRSRCDSEKYYIELIFSLYLARAVLQQHHFPTPHIIPLFDSVTLSRAAVLELGSGIGLLAILLSPLCKSYTASDLLINLRLCSRNLQLNGVDVMSDVGNGVMMEEIDWFDIPTGRGSDVVNTSGYEYDLILAVDCVFNEALAIPLINAMNRYCRVGSLTMALVVVELRSSDVVSVSPFVLGKIKLNLRHCSSWKPGYELDGK